MNRDDARTEQARVEAEIKAAAQAQRKEFRESFGVRILKGNLTEAYTEAERMKASRNAWRAVAIGNGVLALLVWLL